MNPTRHDGNEWGSFRNGCYFALQAVPLQQGQPQSTQAQLPVVQQPQQSQQGACLTEASVAETLVVNTPSRAATARAQRPKIVIFVFMIVSRVLTRNRFGKLDDAVHRVTVRTVRVLCCLFDPERPDKLTTPNAIQNLKRRGWRGIGGFCYQRRMTQVRGNQRKGWQKQDEPRFQELSRERIGQNRLSIDARTRWTKGNGSFRGRNLFVRIDWLRTAWTTGSMLRFCGFRTVARNDAAPALRHRQHQATEDGQDSHEKHLHLPSIRSGTGRWSS
jgi:hypothetical protein